MAAVGDEPAGEATQSTRPGRPVPEGPASGESRASPRSSMLIPVTDDLDTGGFFEAARNGQLAIRRCDGCDAVLHMPRAYCRTCGSWDGRWEPVSGKGTVYSWTVVEHQVHPLYPAPYTVVLVEIDDLPAIRLVGSMQGTPDLAAGQAVEVTFEHIDDDVALPQWRLVSP